MPGVEAVSAATPLPLDGGNQNIPWATEAAGASDPSAFRQANFFVVRPNFFETLKTPLVAGRTFTDDDNEAGSGEGGDRREARGDRVPWTAQPSDRRCSSATCGPTDRTRRRTFASR